jgi:hypothetical protein
MTHFGPASDNQSSIEIRGVPNPLIRIRSHQSAADAHQLRLTHSKCTTHRIQKEMWSEHPSVDPGNYPKASNIFRKEVPILTLRRLIITIYRQSTSNYYLPQTYLAPYPNYQRGRFYKFFAKHTLSYIPFHHPTRTRFSKYKKRGHRPRSSRASYSISSRTAQPSRS